MGVIFISGIFLSFFIVILILTKKQKVLIDRILAAWIALIGIHLLGYYLKQNGYWEEYPHLIGVTAPIPLFHGPMLYLYSLYSLRNDSRIRTVDYLHFLPGIAAYIYMIKFFFFYSAGEKLMLDRGEIADYGLFSIFLLLAILVSGLSYSVLSYRLTILHRNKIGNYFSFRSGISLRWLRYCILSIGLVFMSAAIVFTLRDVFNINFQFNTEYIFYMIMIGLIFYIGYFGIKHENIFINSPQADDSFNKAKHLSEKYRNSGITKEFAEGLYKKLLEVMADEKPYLEPKLSLAAMAEKLGVSTNQLSQIINQEAEVNFHDFINKYRVEEFIRMAGENKKFSLLALALESGFNSKSSFNYIFKKHKGVPPAKYLSGKNR